jgi:hypothetical protein
MRSPTLFVLATMSLIACAPSPPPFAHPDNRAAAVGKSQAEILEEFGAPSDVATDASGQATKLVYIYDDVELSSAPGTPAKGKDYFCQVTFHLTGDKVSAVNAEGPNCNG